MSIRRLPTLAVPVGPGLYAPQTAPGAQFRALDAVNKAIIGFGQIVTSDGSSHSISTSGDSSIGWRSGAVTFANAGTELKVGLALLDQSSGPPARAQNESDVINFQVSKTLIGGGGGVLANTWHEHVPDAGNDSISNGQLAAFCIQMTARGGADSVEVATQQASLINRPGVTTFDGGSGYVAVVDFPNMMLTFADGAKGYFVGCDVFSELPAALSFGSASSPNEYGQLFQFPFAVEIGGLYGWVAPGGNFDMRLYSDPLGTPALQQSIGFDLNAVQSDTVRKIVGMFSTPYVARANTPFVVSYKPTTSTAIGGVQFKRLANAGHRVADVWGLQGYGVQRTGSAAFANKNASLDHCFIGLIAGGFEGGGAAEYILGLS